MADQPAADAFVEQHRIATRLGLHRVQPRHGAFPGGAPDFFGAAQVGLVQTHVAIAVTLHPGAAAGDGGAIGLPVRPGIAAAKAVGGRQVDLRRAIRGPGPLNLRHAIDRHGGRFGGKCIGLKILGRGRGLIVSHVQLRQVHAHADLIRKRQADIGVFGRDPGHVDRALGHFGHRLVPQVRGRDTGLPLTDDHAQTDFNAFRPLDLFQLAGAHPDRGRDPVAGHGIRGLCPGGLCRLQKPGGKIFQTIRHQWSFRSTKEVAAIAPRNKVGARFAVPEAPRAGSATTPSGPAITAPSPSPKRHPQPDRITRSGPILPEAGY